MGAITGKLMQPVSCEAELKIDFSHKKEIEDRSDKDEEKIKTMNMEDPIAPPPIIHIKQDTGKRKEIRQAMPEDELRSCILECY